MTSRKTEKGKLFADLISRVDIALENKFFLEASWIEYSIIEERLLSVIKKVDGRNPGNGFKVDKCLKRLKFLIKNEDHLLLKKHFTIEFLESIREWKNKRNSTMHDLAKKHITEQRVENLAREGKTLMRNLNATIMRFKKDWKKKQSAPDRENIPQLP